MFMIADFEFTIMERHIRMLLSNISYNTFNSTFYMWHEPNMKKDPWEGGGGGFIFRNLNPYLWYSLLQTILFVDTWWYWIANK